MWFFSKIFFLQLLFSSMLFGQIQFSEEAQNLGLANTTYGNGLLGGGISFYDFDNDGWDDLTISSEEGAPVRFFKNNAGVFSEIDLGIVDDLYETKTVQWVDFDNDGDNDFFVTSNIDQNNLFENNGNMEFVNITNGAGLLTIDHRTFGASWGDYNNDGWLDLLIMSRNFDEQTYHTVLYKNNGNHTFSDVTENVGLSLVNHASFCGVFMDYNNDGFQDIYISNDKYNFTNLMYKNNGDDTFTEVGEETGTNISIDAMSTTIGDFNKDGWLDIYVSNTQEGNVFLKNNGEGTFTNIALENGTLMESVAWGAVFLDAENDTDLDLYVSSMLNGNNGTISSVFYENNGNGGYTIPLDAGFENDTAMSFSNALGDVNNDGYPDITVLNYEPQDIYLWENLCPQNNNWLKIKLEGVESNQQGIGSWIEISVNGEKQYNYTLLGEGYLGQNTAFEFFGIGTATSIDYIKVTWLSGIVDFIENPTINSHITITEGEYELSAESNLFTESFVKIYPNPGKVIHIQLASDLIDVNLYVTDTNGRLLLSKNKVSNLDVIDVSNYKSGLYFFTFENEGIRVLKKVIIK